MTEDEQLTVWKQYYPGRKIPGSYQPQDGKCGAQINSTEVRSLQLIRYCTKNAGYGTEHTGIGSCKHHGGSTPNHLRSAARQMVKRDLAELSLALGEAPPLGPPEVEFAILA